VDISEIVCRGYTVAIEVTERMAQGFAPGSADRDHWLQVAAYYRQILDELAMEGICIGTNPAQECEAP